MKVVLNENLHLSFDGVHVNKYQAGDVYEAKSDDEKLVLQELIDMGRAKILLTTKKVEKPTTEII